MNVSRTKVVGTFRGLHVQDSPHAELKVMRCLREQVWDVALGLRRGLPTSLRWHAEERSLDNARILLIPESNGHGFQVLDAGNELHYLHAARFEPQSETGVRLHDPVVEIAWPLTAADIPKRYICHALLPQDFSGIAV